jgi:hypothetical protein
MLKKEYYCLIAGLPDLFFNENKLKFNSLQFREEIKAQINPKDYKLLEYLFLPFDNKNLLNLLFHLNETFSPYAILSEKELNFQFSPENEIMDLPKYMLDFINWVNKNEIKQWSLKAENKLHQNFYEHALTSQNAFLNEWFAFELNLKNLLTAFDCKRFNRERADQIIQINQNLTSFNLINNKVLRPELFEDEIPFTKQIFKVAESDLNWIEKERAIDKIKWDYLDDNTFFFYFTIEKVLSYVIKILITERWMQLDAETGRTLLYKLLNELKSSYQFTEEFSLNK